MYCQNVLSPPAIGCRVAQRVPPQQQCCCARRGVRKHGNGDADYSRHAEGFGDLQVWLAISCWFPAQCVGILKYEGQEHGIYANGCKYLTSPLRASAMMSVIQIFVVVSMFFVQGIVNRDAKSAIMHVVPTLMDVSSVKNVVMIARLLRHTVGFKINDCCYCSITPFLCQGRSHVRNSHATRQRKSAAFWPTPAIRMSIAECQ
jgi:hypothetical protein